MSLLDDYGIDNWYDYESLNTELTQNINSINHMYSKYTINSYSNSDSDCVSFDSDISNNALWSVSDSANDSVSNNALWSVESAFLFWILLLNYMKIYQFWQDRNRLRIML
jgi:hypothetical protein